MMARPQQTSSQELAPMPSSLDQQLDHIAADLAAWLDTSADPGLMDGSAGAALFFGHLSAHTGRDHHHMLTERALVATLDVLHGQNDRAPVGSSLCSGLAGVAWCLDHLVQHDVVELDSQLEELLSDLDVVLADAVVTSAAAGQLDLLHSSLGAIVYLTGRPASPRVSSRLAETVGHLRRHAIRDDRGSRWPDPTRPGEFDLGLAHGASSTVCLLARLVRAGIATTESTPLLAEAARWLESTRLPQPSAKPPTALFPSSVDEHGAPSGRRWSRLGWCYGDLGVAIGLLSAGMALGDQSLLGHATTILEEASRRSPEEGEVADAGLCHGSLGIMQMYLRASIALDAPHLAAVGTRWFEHSHRFAGRSTDEAAGFRARTPHGYRITRSLLQGTAGIGLGLLAGGGFIGPTSKGARPWDEWMLPIPQIYI
jgi:lantibiotic modifying enzyme